MIFISSLAFIISVLWDCNFQRFYKTVSLLVVGIIVNYIYYKSSINYAYSNAYCRVNKCRGEMFYDEWE